MIARITRIVLVCVLLALGTQGDVSQQVGQLSSRSDPVISKYAVYLTDSGALLSAPLAVSITKATYIFASVAAIQPTDNKGVVAFREGVEGLLWTSFDENCDGGPNPPLFFDNIIYQSCHVRAGSSSLGGVLAINATTGATLFRWMPPESELGVTSTGSFINAVTDTHLIVSGGNFDDPICTGTPEGALYSLRKADRSISWTLDGQWSPTRGIVADGTLTIAFQCGDVSSVSLDTGTIVSTKQWVAEPSGRAIKTYLTVDEDKRLYTAVDRTLHMEDTSGQTWQYELPLDAGNICAMPVVDRLPSSTELPHVFVATENGRMYGLQPQESLRIVTDGTTVSGSSVLLEGTSQLKAINRWRVQPFDEVSGKKIALSSNITNPTFATVVDVRIQGLMYVSTWQGGVYELGMQNGELQPDQWFPTGDSAHVTVDLDLLLFTRGRQLYVNILPEINPKLTSSNLLSPFWRVDFTVAFEGVLFPEDFQPNQDAYVSAFVRSMADTATANIVVKMSPVINATESATTPAQDGNSSVPAPSPLQVTRRLLDVQDSTEAAAIPDMPISVYLQSSGRSTVRRDQVSNVVDRILLEGTKLLAQELVEEATNDVTGSFVLPSAVSITSGGIEAQFEGIEEEASLITLSGTSESATPASDAAAAVDRGMVADGQQSGGLETWQIVLVVVCALCMLAAVVALTLFGLRYSRGSRLPPAKSYSHLEVAHVHKACHSGSGMNADASPDTQFAAGHYTPASGEQAIMSSVPSWLSSIDGLHKDSQYAMEQAMHDPAFVGHVPTSGVTASAASVTAATAAALPVRAIAAAVEELLCDVAAKASSRTPQAPSLAAAIVGVCKHVIARNVTGQHLFQDKYVLPGDPQSFSIQPHAVCMIAEGAAGGIYGVHFIVNSAHFENEWRLRVDQRLAPFFDETVEMAPASAGRGVRYGPQRWKVVACDVILQKLLQEHRSTDVVWPFLESMRVLGQVSMRLEAMHNAGFSHGNIGSSNVFWREVSQQWLLSDLSAARPFFAPVPFDVLCISVRNAPPELVVLAEAGAHEVEVAASTDAWQLGLLAYELASGQPLFHTGVRLEDVLAILSGRAALPWESSQEAYFAKVEELGVLGKSILMLLERDPQKRVSVRAIRPMWVDILKDALAK